MEYIYGKNSTTDYSKNRLRVTLNARGAGGNVYTGLRKILLYLSTNGATGTKVKLEARTIGNYNEGKDTWSTISTSEVSGWAGWNSIPYNCSFGGGSTQTTQIAQIRLTFEQSGGTANMVLYNIRVIGITNWNTASNLGRGGHMYTYDIDQNVTFPAKVTATKFVGNALNTDYGTCSTAAGTAAKVVTIANTDWSLGVGSVIGVKFTNSNTASNVTLNVNNTGAKSIYYNNAVYTSTSTTVCGYANRTSFYMYDGTYWVWISCGTEFNDNTYTSAYCSTAAGTAAKVGTQTNYKLLAKSYNLITITTANSAASALTLNINSTGAKPIYINGKASSSTNYTLPAGTYIIYYDGTNYYFRTDGYIQGYGKILYGTTVPASSLGNDGDFYVRYNA